MEKINIDFLSQAYFYFDFSVPYKVEENKTLYIFPIFLKDSEFFLASCDILNINKNASPSVEIIQMSYLEFLCKYLLQQNLYKDKLSTILKFCLHFKEPSIIFKNNKPFLRDEELDLEINAKQFDDIRRIIMYQNILHYDDSYINPDLKKAIDEAKELKNKKLVTPSIERKIAIITSHCGLPKREQLEMTYRSHCLLFEEVSGEVEFETTRPVALRFNQEIEHWIYKNKKGKFEDYIMDADKYQQMFGAGNKIAKAGEDSNGNKFEKMYENFQKI